MGCLCHIGQYIDQECEYLITDCVFPLYLHKLVYCYMETFLWTVKLSTEFVWNMKDMFHHKYAARKLGIFLNHNCILDQIFGSKQKQRKKEKVCGYYSGN